MARKQNEQARIKDGEAFVEWLKTYRDAAAIAKAYTSDKLTENFVGAVYKAWALNNGVEVKRVGQDQKDWTLSLIESWAEEEGLEQDSSSEGASEDDEDFDEEAQDESTDEGEPEADDEDEAQWKGSVVNAKYRRIYKEAGHPDNCGDWLALELEQFHGPDGFDLEQYCAILAHNAIDAAKYMTEEKQATRGWQGRLRMTTRAMLQRKVVMSGKLNVSATKSIKAPADWLEKHAVPEKKSPVSKAEKEAAKAAKAKLAEKEAKKAARAAKKAA